MDSHYKKLNTELIAEVQSLRLKLGIMRKNEVILQAQLIDERAIQQKELRRAVNKFVQSLGISIGLEADNDEITKYSTDTEQSVPATRPTRSIIERRSSVERRSMNLTRSSSSLTLSPSDKRRSTSRKTDDFQQLQEKEEHTNITVSQQTPPPRHIADLDDDYESPIAENATANASTEPPTSDTSGAPNLFLIVEEETAFNITSATESITSVSDESSVTIPENARTISPSGRALRDLSINVPGITIGRGKEKHARPTLNVPIITFDTTNEDDGELSVQQVRHAISCSPGARMKLTLSGGNTSMLMTTPRRSQFNGIADMPGCTSTPCQLTSEVHGKQKKQCKKKDRDDEEEQETQLNSTYSSRPSRSCRPTTLAEPQLRTKLRNPTETKKRKSSRPKSST